MPPPEEGGEAPPADGEAPAEGEEAVEEEEDWDAPMPENDILMKIGNINFEMEALDCPVERSTTLKSGMLPFFLSAAKYGELGLVDQQAKSNDVYFSGKNT